MINSKNEAARFKSAAQRCKKYRESMIAGNHRGTVLCTTLKYRVVQGQDQKINQRALKVALAASKSTIEVLLSVSTCEQYVFKVRLPIMINSKNEAARFKRVAQPRRKYRESMTAVNYTGKVLL